MEPDKSLSETSAIVQNDITLRQHATNNHQDTEIISINDNQGDENYYLSNFQIPGHVLIFNHVEFDLKSGQNPREGSQKDTANLLQCFTELNFESQVHNDMTLNEIKSKIEETAKRDWSNYGSICVVVLTHGDRNGKIWAKDEHYHTSDIWNPLINNKSLQDKPKIFIFQACRGNHGKAVRGDIDGTKVGSNTLTSQYIQKLKNNVCECQNVQLLPHSPDVLVAYSTVEFCKSIRNTATGTWYIQSLCNELKRLPGHNTDLLSLITNVTKNIVEENDGDETKEYTYGQTPTFVSFLTRKIYFRDTNPVSRPEALEYDWSQYNWRGQARIYHDNDHEHEAKVLADTLKICDFTSIVRHVDCHETYIDDVNKLQDNFDEEACIIIAVLAKYEEDKHFNKYLPQLVNSVSLSYQEHRRSLAGKPKIIFFFDKQMETPTELLQTDAVFQPKYVTQHSDFLIVRGFGTVFLNDFLSQLTDKKNIIDSVTKVIARANDANPSCNVSHFESTLRANIWLDNKMEAIPIEFVQDTNENITTNGIYYLLHQRNVDGYVERKHAFSQIKTAMLSKEVGHLVDVVIAGMPGVGKSQLALSYAKNSGGVFKNIIMLDATSKESLQHYFLLLAKKCNIMQNNENMDYLRTETYKYLNSSNTLFIFDNASPDMIELIPQSTVEFDNLYFIFTSNTTDWGTTVDTKVKKVITLDKFSEIETNEFLTSIFKNINHSAHDLKKLGDEVDHLPLSLQLAAAYIIQSAIDGIENPVSSYIEKISTSGYEGQDDEHISKLEKVWNPTLMKIKNGEGTAMTIINVIAYFEPYNIPKHLFEQERKRRRDAAIKILKKYSVITQNDGKIHIHKMLQNIIRTRIERDNIEEVVLKKGMKLMEKQLLYARKADGIQSLPIDCSLHSAKLIRHAIKYPQLVTDCPEISACTILTLNENYNLQLSTDLGKELQPIFDSMDKLAGYSLEFKAIRCETKVLLGHYNEALEDINTLLNDHGNYDNDKLLFKVALLYHIKADLLHKLGKHKESVVWHREVIRYNSQILKENDCRLIATKHNLAGVLQELEEYDEALAIYFEIMDLENSSTKPQESQKDTSIETILAEIEISKILQSKGLFDDSKYMLDEAIRKLELKVGSKDPLVLSEKHNRNNLLDNLGVKSSDILADYLQIYEQKCEVLGKHHPSTQETASRIATLYNRTGSEQAAERLYNDVIKSLEKSLGKKHSTVLCIKHNAAFGIERAGDYFNALSEYLKIYTDQCETLGKEHSSTLSTRERMAYCLYMLKRAEPALEMYDEIIKSWIAKVGENHPDIQVTRHNRAMVLNILDRNDEALAEFNDIVTIDEQIYGLDHIMTLKTKERIANVLRETGNLEEAKLLFDEILPKLKSNLGSQHDDVICARVNRARVLEDMGKYTSAIKVYIRCKAIFKANHGPTYYLTQIVEDLYGKVHDKIFENDLYEYDSDNGDIADDFEYPPVEEQDSTNESSSNESEG